MTFTGRELRTTLTEDGTLTLSLEDVTVPAPGPDEIVVRVEAAPINPSDLGLLLGPADMKTLESSGTEERPIATFRLPKAILGGLRPRIGQSLAVGNEGAGIVVAAGEKAKALEGRRVGMVGGAMFADYRVLKAREALPLPDGATSAEGAAMFVNPLTALGFVETMRMEGHTAIVHTAAASNLGQMLQKLCLADGIPLVNIVRSEEQADILRALGATHVLDSRAEDFRKRLTDAVAETGATLAFDAIGGGDLGSTVLQAMEQAASRNATEYSRYGSSVFKQLYVYGALDPSPSTLNRLAFGFTWSVSGWLLFNFLRRAGAEVNARMRQRVVDELTTTFASRYTATIGLAEALRPDVLKAYERKATGEKYLIDPTRG
ncbi:zinc-binding dehydrogenase [Sphingomonas sp. CGMCC 1.13654]|uniref:Zinc-binding dehydrogenase n=1 Tax=Sphingomonas chungangi TaxID=2683589 RepID=A0A838L006_9SPHN|nr:zinc-binding dehydrogenase [Sphingomonas chungangi]MBA2932671.1 zinc-binding dehydrogenase [Sphingomonas chungangi]MVW56294.1 zinc-binding dehydrogenase [Sphingomonas chungangi]